MLAARLLVVGLLAAAGVLSTRADDRPRGTLIVQAMYLRWPDGSLVESGGLHYPTDIYVVDTYGRSVRNVTHDSATNYLTGWLPDAQRILYESVPSDRMRRGRSGIYSVKPDGTALRRLASGTAELFPKLSSDRHRVLFAQGRWLFVMRTDGTQMRRLARFGSYGLRASGQEFEASWSPDGTRIAFVRRFDTHEAYSSHSALYVVDVDGTGLRRLTAVRPKLQTSDPEWSPDGRTIAFAESSYRTLATESHAYVIRPDGTHRQRLGRLEGPGFWLPNGRMAYQTMSGRYESIDPNRPDEPEAVPSRIRIGSDLLILSDGSTEWWPLSPDGKWIALTRHPRTLSVATVDGTRTRVVTRKICCLVWSYDLAWADG